MSAIKRLWNSLPPGTKRIAVFGGCALVLMLGTALTASLSKSGKAKGAAPREPIRNVLSDRDMRDMGLEGMAANLSEVNSTTRQLQQRIAQLESRRAAAIDKGASDALRRELDAVRQQLDALKAARKAETTPHFPATTGVEEDTGALFRMPLPAKAVSAKGAKLAAETPFQIFHHSEAEKPAEKAASDESQDSLYLPAGSLLTGVLLTGLDAPTHQGARREPFPVALRIQKDAILPNRFSADVRECFLILSGYGDLSAERAYLRGETLSCVREDGGVVESKLKAFAIGEDGKSGVRGRLVSKQGQIVAKSLIAGFLSGVSKAFDVNPILALNLNGGGSTQYQSVFSPGALQGAGAKGASTALDRIAKFYLDMAENLFPVIEVDAGREIDLILTQGAALRLISSHPPSRRHR